MAGVKDVRTNRPNYRDSQLCKHGDRRDLRDARGLHGRQGEKFGRVIWSVFPESSCSRSRRSSTWRTMAVRVPGAPPTKTNARGFRRAFLERGWRGWGARAYWAALAGPAAGAPRGGGANRGGPAASLATG